MSALYYRMKSGVLQGSVLRLSLHLMFTSDLAVAEDTTTGTFADDTAILGDDISPERVSQKL